MKYNQFLGLLLTMAVCFSCSKADFEEDDGKQGSETQFLIQANVHVNEPWVATTTRADEESPEAVMMCYLFDNEGNFIINRGRVMTSDAVGVVRFREVYKPGTYTIYCITGWYRDEFLSPSAEEVTLDKVLQFHSAKDMCLGKAVVEVGATQVQEVNIEVDHMMSKVSFVVNNVPSVINSMSVVIHNQAGQFKFDGTILGESNSQTLTLTRGVAGTASSSYNWSVEDAIVFPIANASEKMQITIIADGEMLHTESDTPCTPGKCIRYTAEFDGFVYQFNPTTIVIKPWTEVVEDAEVVPVRYVAGGASGENAGG